MGVVAAEADRAVLADAQADRVDAQVDQADQADRVDAPVGVSFAGGRFAPSA